MKFASLILAGLLLSVLAAAQPAQKKVFNYGVMAGVNAPFVDIHSFSVNGQRMNNPTVSSRVGYLVALFSRVNMRRHFIQLEASTHYSRSDFHLNLGDLLPESPGDQVPAVQLADYHERIRSVEIPLLYGYNFIKSGPYELSFLIGPKLKYIFNRQGNVKERIGKEVVFDEDLNRCTLNLVLGLSTTISNLLLSARYEFGLQDISESLNYGIKTGGNYYTGTADLRRAMNLISVSVGVMF